MRIIYLLLLIAFNIVVSAQERELVSSATLCKTINGYKVVSSVGEVFIGEYQGTNLEVSEGFLPMKIALGTNINNDKNIELDISPNPVIDIIEINNVNPGEDKILLIYDMAGRCVLEQEYIKNRINLSSLKSGSYIISIYEKNNVAQKKFIKL